MMKVRLDGIVIIFKRSSIKVGLIENLRESPVNMHCPRIVPEERDYKRIHEEKCKRKLGTNIMQIFHLLFFLL